MFSSHTGKTVLSKSMSSDSLFGLEYNLITRGCSLENYHSELSVVLMLIEKVEQVAKNTENMKW